ncbi:hypothetical protein KCU81_g8517, partial [Aureobasidium melanogenum]|uniref:F-box domain-containing protein n=1 Tax=Aureobasidium melanogenum (strain CBS 110374) TaxID=1043003 RepID=A0A074VYV4_AURM1
MATSPSLFGLPNELLAMIIDSDDLTVKDLANLRLSCKHTKHFASSALGKRIFVDFDVRYTREAFHWYTALLLSDLGGYVRSVSLISSGPRLQRSYPLRKYVKKKIGNEPTYSQLQHLTIQWSGGPVRSWERAVCAASHLKTLRLAIPDEIFMQLGVFRHTFDRNDELLGSIKSDSLSTVVLARLHVSASVLNQLLDLHKETLSTLEIRSCLLVDGNWLEMLEWIRLNLSHLQTLYLDVRHEAVKKKLSRYQQHTIGISYGSSYLESSPYATKTYEASLRLRFGKQKDIEDGLLAFLKAQERDQAQ